MVYWTKEPPRSWMVDIILRPESKGASSTRGVAFSRSCFFMPREQAKFTSAHSVGSPSAWSLSFRLASEQRAMAVATSSVSPT